MRRLRPGIIRNMVKYTRNAEKKQVAAKEVCCDLPLWWRGQDSNLRPLGYEPNELPLLHPAMFSWCKGRYFSIASKLFGIKIC